MAQSVIASVAVGACIDRRAWRRRLGPADAVSFDADYADDADCRRLSGREICVHLRNLRNLRQSSDVKRYRQRRPSVLASIAAPGAGDWVRRMPGLLTQIAQMTRIAAD